MAKKRIRVIPNPPGPPPEKATTPMFEGIILYHENDDKERFVEVTSDGPLKGKKLRINSHIGFPQIGDQVRFSVGTVSNQQEAFVVKLRDKPQGKH